MPASSDQSQQTSTDPQASQSESDETAVQSPNRSRSLAGFGPACAPGEVGALGPYRVVKKLGQGGMGAVYAALDTRLDRKLALKVMLPEFAADTGAKERFVREARAAAKVGHDNVVTVYEADERDGVPYIAMQFLEGCPLDQFIKNKGTPTIQQTLRIATETAAGLAAAHKLGLVHRDIKPGNLWLEAPNGRVKVLDFGLAKPVDAEAELTKSGAVVGTPAYMSPEQARGEKVDHRTDLFSLGAVLYRLCTGKLPFHGATTMAVLMALGTEEPRPVRELNPQVPEALAALVHQLLSKRAADRPQSAAEVVKRLRAIAAELAAPRATPVDQSASQPQLLEPQVVYVPIQVTAPPPSQSPFADLDEPGTEATAPERASRPLEPKPTRAKRRDRAPLLIACGLLALSVLLIAGVIIVIKNKDGTETKIEVPDGATVTVKGKDGKTRAQVGPEKPAGAGGPDRTAAEYALSAGGAVYVSVDGQAVREFTAAADLPRERFTLTLVNLDGRKVTDAGLASFKGCTGLTWIDLGNAPGVTAAGLANFKDSKGLTHLGLNGCTGLTDAGLAPFKGCTTLTRLSLLNVPATDAGLANFKDCKGLTLVNLNGTKATDAGLAHFKDCTGLTGLDLGATGATDAGLAYFKDCKLTVLNVNGARPVTDAGLAHFKDCKFTALQLGDTQVTDAGLANFKNCTGLTMLYLYATKVSDAGLANFKNCTELTHLELTGVAVTDAGLAQFRDCKKLTIVDVRQTKVTAKGLADFHAAVPGCRIEYDGGTIEPKK